MREYKGFKCPECGGYKWGTSHCTEPKDKWIGHCHGSRGFPGCGFTWHRMTEDEKYIGKPLNEKPNAEVSRRSRGDSET